MADVAREAGIAVGSLYLEFDAKEEILEALSSQKHQAVLEALRVASATSRPYAERLRALFDARLDAFLAAADGGVHGVDLVYCQHTAIKAAHQTYRDREHALVCALLREGAAASELDVAKPELTARAILAAYARFAPPWLYEGGCGGGARDELRLLLRAMHEVVLYGLVRRKKR